MTFYPPQRDFDIWDWAEARVEELWGNPSPEEILDRIEQGLPADITLGFVLDHSDTRRELCRADPLLFAWVYLRKDITDKGTGEVSFAQPHLDWCELARQWMDGTPGIAEWRRAFIAPRETGKSTWWFLIIPMWGLAYGHVSFVVAFANATGQAEGHLQTFRLRMDNQQDLRHDFRELCAPARRAGGSQVADRQGMLHCKSGAVFAARGVDSASLGLKVEDRRPDVIIADDLEPEEARYSAELAKKRLGTLLEGILPLNIRARFVLVGTTTMPESICHQLVKTAHGLDEPELEWVYRAKIVCHHQLPLIQLDDGTEVSAWPQKWSTEWLLENRGTRDYMKNYECDPLARDGLYWQLDDFRWGEVPALSHAVLSCDPAVTDRAKSDFTGLAVVAYSTTLQRCVVRYARAVKVPPGEKLREIVLGILEEFPQIAGLLVEVNQGGMAWEAIFHDMPVPVKTVHQSAHKESRAGDLLAHYQRGRVWHETKLPGLEGQMVSFPRGLNDDLIDAVGAGVAVFLDKILRKKKTAGSRNLSYV